MAFRAGDRAIATVEITTLMDIRDRFLDVHGLQTTEERQCVHGDVEKPGIDLAKCVTCEYPGGLLE